MLKTIVKKLETDMDFRGFFRRTVLFAGVVFLCLPNISAAPAAAGQSTIDDSFPPLMRALYQAFDDAWESFRKGDLEEAERIGLAALEDDSHLPSKLQANFLFLMAAIQSRTGRLGEALLNYQEAKVIYDSLGLYKGVFDSQLGIAELQLADKNRSGARETLKDGYKMARRVSKGKGMKVNFGLYYHLSAKLALLDGDFEGALSAAQESYRHYYKSNSRPGIANALSDIGFYLMLLGDYKAGYEKALEAEEYGMVLNDQNKYYYNLINFVLYNRCTESGDYAKMVSMIEKRIERDKDEALKYFLDFVLTCDCASPGANFNANDSALGGTIQSP